LKTFWIFGASKPLGNTMLRGLARNYKVITFSRSDVPALGKHKQHFNVDFSNDIDLHKVVEEAIRLHGFPDGAAFCQRNRENQSELLLGISKGIQIELGPTLALLDRIKDRKKVKSLSIVMFTSIANEQINPDISLSYHIVKAATSSFVRYQAMALRHLEVRINAIVLGEFLKYSIESYSSIEQKKFAELARISNIGRICTVQDAVSLAQFLLTNPSLTVNGQLIHLDGGVSRLAPESLVRDTVNRGFF